MQESNHRIWQQGVLTVYEELQSSDSEGEMNENDDNEDDFDGYLDETEMEECWSQRAIEGNSDEDRCGGMGEVGGVHAGQSGVYNQFEY